MSVWARTTPRSAATRACSPIATGTGGSATPAVCRSAAPPAACSSATRNRCPSTPATPLFAGGSRGREHLLEVYVTDAEGGHRAPRHGDVTRPPRVWTLTDAERLALVALGRRYLQHEPRPQPLTWRQTAAQLADVRSGEGWTDKRVEHLVNAVRLRLSRDGVPGLTREEVGEPVGNALNDHLIRALLTSTTLVPMDLAVIDGVVIDGA